MWRFEHLILWLVIFYFKLETIKSLRIMLLGLVSQQSPWSGIVFKNLIDHIHLSRYYNLAFIL